MRAGLLSPPLQGEVARSAGGVSPAARERKLTSGDTPPSAFGCHLPLQGRRRKKTLLPDPLYFGRVAIRPFEIIVITATSSWLKTVRRPLVMPISGRLCDTRFSIVSLSQRSTSPG